MGVMREKRPSREEGDCPREALTQASGWDIIVKRPSRGKDAQEAFNTGLGWGSHYRKRPSREGRDVSGKLLNMGFGMGTL
ncbi:hypothetical protein AVEN_103061-1 [Araneus ventricosus]|uniref:Uncharacterized protein n=1 Tax=Araneus ventricosus TaxID=182803 RepID=A0A4Y2B9H2_ARAVE|nr:hypothetical protein AVEN_103061-1 [Araneus ventricosus]